MDEARKGSDPDPTSDLIQFFVGWTDIQASRISQAIPELRKAYEIGSAAQGANWASDESRVTDAGVGRRRARLR
jgi:hypothetical protein